MVPTISQHAVLDCDLGWTSYIISERSEGQTIPSWSTERICGHINNLARLPDGGAI